MSRPSRFALVAALLAAGVLSVAPPAQADTETIKVDTAFSPSVKEITAGETVTWEWAGGGAHQIVHDPGPGQTSPEFDFPLTSGTHGHAFSQVDEYAYHCAVHPDMTGTIKVAAPATTTTTEPPTTTTTEPPTTTTTAAPTTTTTRPTTSTTAPTSSTTTPTTSGGSTTTTRGGVTTTTGGSGTTTTEPGDTDGPAPAAGEATTTTAKQTTTTKKGDGKKGDKPGGSSTTTSAPAPGEPDLGSLAEQLPNLPGVLNTGDGDTTPTTSDDDSLYAQDASSSGGSGGRNQKALFGAIGIMGLLGAAGGVQWWRKRSDRYWAA